MIRVVDRTRIVRSSLGKQQVARVHDAADALSGPDFDAGRRKRIPDDARPRDRVDRRDADAGCEPDYRSCVRGRSRGLFGRCPKGRRAARRIDLKHRQPHAHKRHDQCDASKESSQPTAIDDPILLCCSHGGRGNTDFCVGMARRPRPVS